MWSLKKSYNEKVKSIQRKSQLHCLKQIEKYFSGVLQFRILNINYLYTYKMETDEQEMEFGYFT